MSDASSVGEVSDLKDMSELMSLCKRRGFVFPSSEIYGGINACWDFGPLGVELKRNVKEQWWQAMVGREDMEGIDAAILMHPKVWEASGHVAGFSDPMIDCKKCKARFRADQLDQAHCPQKPSKKPGQCDGELTEPRNFNLMFKTFMGPVEESASIVYLRPETAQGIFVNFINVQQSSRQKVPFGIAQIGKSFRNEITPGNFFFRTREFEQMEMQFFVKPGTDMDWFEKWKAWRMEWHLSNGIRKNKLRYHEHPKDKLAHYAKAAFDIEYEYSFGWGELEGIHNRTDFDLSQHQKFSGKKLEYFDEANKERYTPYIVETAVGCDRTCLVILSDAFRKQPDKEGERIWMQFHPKYAPYKVGIFPLMKKPELQQITDKIYTDVKKRFRATYDDAGSIGKRYRRQDEIGTPYGVTIDYDSLTDNKVTVRHRDTMAQERVPFENLIRYIEDGFQNWNSII